MIKQFIKELRLKKLEKRMAVLKDEIKLLETISDHGVHRLTNEGLLTLRRLRAELRELIAELVDISTNKG